MLYSALVFLVIALIVGFLGFGGIAFAGAGIAKLLFFIFFFIFPQSLLRASFCTWLEAQRGFRPNQVNLGCLPHKVRHRSCEENAPWLPQPREEFHP